MNKPAREPVPAVDAGAIEVEAHPPERRHRSVVVASPSCCCCCCCLHSLGGLIGAAVASAPPKGRSGVGIYWLVVAGAVALTPFVGLAWGLSEGLGGGGLPGVEDLSQQVGGSLFVLLMVAPAVQLGASLVALVVIGLIPDYRFADKGASLWALGRITLATVLGTGVGILVMFLTCMAMR